MPSTGSRIKKRPGLINGNPRDLAKIDWSKEWNPDGKFGTASVPTRCPGSAGEKCAYPMAHLRTSKAPIS